MQYVVDLYAAWLECRDTESLSRRDLFRAAGAVVVDGTAHGFEMPPMAIRPGERLNAGGWPSGPGHLFRGFSESDQIGLVLRGYDVDNNEEWRRNREEIGDVAEWISKGLEYVPVVGDVLAPIVESFPELVDVFVDLDKDDVLVNHAMWIPLESSVPGRTYTDWRKIEFRGDDATGYSDWDYTLHLRVVYTPTADSLGELRPPRLRPHQGSVPSDWIGQWQSPRVNLAVVANASSADLVDVYVTEEVDGQRTDLVTVGVGISKPFVEQAVGGVEDAPLTVDGTDPGAGGLVVSTTVEGVAAGQGGAGGPAGPFEPGGGGRPRDGAVLDEPPGPAGPWRRLTKSKADYLWLEGDAMLEIYQEKDRGEVVGAKLRYVRPADVTTRSGALPLDEMLQTRVV